MKKSCSTLLPIVFLAFSSLCFAQSEPSVSVGKIVFDSKPHIESTSLKNMPHIDYVLTTGKFAWAVDENSDPSSPYTASAIFFDGQNWSSAGGQNVPGMKKIFHIYPAYPISGLYPYAWADGADDKGQRVIAYFNGQTWSPAKLASSIFDTVSWQMQASAGRAYLMGQTWDAQGKPFTVYSTMDAGAAAEQNWSKSISIPGQYSNADTFNDSNPYLFFLSDPKGEGTRAQNLVRINPDNSNTVINLKNLSAPYGELLVVGTQVYVNYPTGSAYQAMLAYNNNNGDGTWTYTQDIDNFSLTSVDWSEQYQGLVCKYYNSSNSKLSLSTQLSLGCIDFNNSQPEWTPSLRLPSQAKSWFMMTSNNSSWISYIDNNSLPQVLHYDVSQRRLDNLNYPQTTGVNVLQSRVVDNNQIIACSWDKSSNKTNVSIYDLTASTWTPISVPTDITGCGFSFSGGVFPQARNIDLNNGEQMWLYNYTG